ncbi:MAG: IS200/IS605 family transposase [Phycisphaerales bacterium]|nr:IS200/IS605 family transposase [Phycisphaerales bacterium]
MAGTLTRVLLHITFSTRGREPLIPESMEAELYAYIGGICRNHGSLLMAMGGMPDHVHMLISLAKTTALADLMLHLKRDSSRWMKERSDGGFGWQEGYFAFSIGESGVEELRRYIADQKGRHRTKDFKAELREFLAKYRIDFDDDRMWD